jgi:PAS domain S-box-containing protein
MNGLYHRLLEFTHDGVYRYRFEDGRVLMANQGLVDILELDCTPREVEGRYLHDLLVYTEREGTVRQALEEKGEIHGYEYHFRTLAGHDKWVIHDSFISQVPRTDELMVEAIVKDITERKEAQRELQEYRRHLEELVEERTARLEESNQDLEQEIQQHEETEKELERSNEELEEFAYVASHDLQEPLRKITAFGERLASRCGDELDDRARDYLERMQHASERMRDLISDLLTFSRVTTRAQPFKQVDLTQVAEEVVSDLEIQIQEVDGEVEVEPLPIIDAEPTQMRQLLQNLIGNGLKFHRDHVPSRVKVEAEITRDETGEEVCRLRVTDNGIGFDEKYLDRIFTIFQRLHPRGEYAGTGVGLALCGKIARRHGGTITAQSQPGQGATFLVTLPVEHEDQD